MRTSDALGPTEMARLGREKTVKSHNGQECPLPSDFPAVVRALHAFTSKARIDVSPFDETPADQPIRCFEPVDTSLESAQEAPHCQTDPKSSGETSETPLARHSARSMAGGTDVVGRLTRRAGILALGLTLLAAGFVLGRGEMGPAVQGPQILQNVLSAHVRSLKQELAEAEHQIAILNTALEISEKNANHDSRDMIEVRHLLENEGRSELFEPALSQSPSPEPAATELNVALEQAAHLKSKLQSLYATAQTLTEDEGQAGRRDNTLSRNVRESAAELPTKAETTAFSGTGNTLRAGARLQSEPLPAGPKPTRPLNEL